MTKIMPLEYGYLSELEITHEEIQALSNEDQLRKIRKQYLKLSLERHPDKNRGDAYANIKFNRLNVAYCALKRILVDHSIKSYQSELMDYFNHEDITIPITAFDWEMQENIGWAYKRLEKKFLALQSENSKKSFGKHYGSFFNLSISLEKNSDNIISRRQNFLYQQVTEINFLKTFSLEWRRMMISTYGEEFLDDFQYRHVMAFGDIYSIFATRKLLSPVKAVCVALNTVILFIITGAQTLSRYANKYILDEVENIQNRDNSGTLRFRDVFLLGLKILGIIAVFSSPLYIGCLFMPFIIGMSLPIVSAIANMIACPVNTLIRPLSHRLGISSEGLSLFCAVTCAALLFGLVSSLTLASVLAGISWLTLPLVAYSLYGNMKLVVNIYKKNPAMGIVLGIISACSLIIGLLSPIPSNIDLNAPVVTISLFLTHLTNCIIFHNFNKFIKNPQPKISEIMDTLPLPEEPVPKSIQTAALIGSRLASQSNRFFNTPKNAEYIEKSDRTFWQKSSSFFGGGAVKSNCPSFESDQVPMILAQST